MKSEELSQAILNIYDAEIDPSKWRDMLDHAADTVGARSALLMIVDGQNQELYQEQYFNSVFEDLGAEKWGIYKRRYSYLEREAWELLSRQPPRTILTDDSFGVSEDSEYGFKKVASYSASTSISAKDLSCR